MPSVVLVIGNSAIFYKYTKSKYNLQASAVVPQHVSQRQRQRIKSKVTATTAILGLLNFVFLFTTTPVSNYIIGYNSWYNEGDDKDLAILSLMWPVTNILMYTNNTVNSGLYVLTSTKLRSETQKLFCCSKGDNTDTQTQRNNNVNVGNVRRIDVREKNSKV